MAKTSFLAVAAVMYFTRNIDWYSSISAGGVGIRRQQRGRRVRKDDLAVQVNSCSSRFRTGSGNAPEPVL